MGIFPCAQNLSALRRMKPMFSVFRDCKLCSIMPGKRLNHLAEIYVVVPSIQNIDVALPVVDRMLPHKAEIRP